MQTFRASALALLAALSSAAVSAAEPPSARIEQGELRGLEREGILAFRNIPYAAPPAGEWRWRPPRPAPRWSSPRDATGAGPVCPQDDRVGELLAEFTQSEDCLNLNVFTPALASPGRALLPVMVWLHGGSFRWGAGSLPYYDGSRIASEGVVVVTINYRLDRLGRFAHPALSASQPDEPLGNYALMDQLAALRWVRDNIAVFGGNPAQVTLFGCSAGGVSVNALLAMPAARGLFQRAIAQSGGISVEVSARLDRPAGRFKALEQDGLEFAESLGIANDARAPERLRALGVADVLAYPQKDSSMNPVVDGRLIQDDLGRAFAAGRQHRVPYLAGSVSYEASLIAPFRLPLRAVLLDTPLERAQAAYATRDETRLRDEYFGDYLFGAPARFIAGSMARAGAPAYVYYYDFVPPGQAGELPGAPHCSEVAGVFGFSRTPGVELGEAERAVGAALRKAFVSFARQGEPGALGASPWPAYAPDATWVMQIGAQSGPRRDLFSERMELHFERYREALQ